MGYDKSPPDPGFESAMTAGGAAGRNLISSDHGPQPDIDRLSIRRRLSSSNAIQPRCLLDIDAVFGALPATTICVPSELRASEGINQASWLCFTSPRFSFRNLRARRQYVTMRQAAPEDLKR
jgi:hypothetical protein